MVFQWISYCTLPFEGKPQGKDDIDPEQKETLWTLSMKAYKQPPGPEPQRPQRPLKNPSMDFIYRAWSKPTKGPMEKNKMPRTARKGDGEIRFTQTGKDSADDTCVPPYHLLFKSEHSHPNLREPLKDLDLSWVNSVKPLL